MNPDMRIATAQRLPQLRTNSNPSAHSVTAFHDYHSDPITDPSTDDYAGESSSLISNEATRDSSSPAPPSRLHIPASNREFVQSEATIPQIAHAGRRALPMQSEHARFPTAEELAMSLDSSPPTPNVNDSLFLQFALDQLTRDENVRRAAQISNATTEGSYPVERVVTGTGTVIGEDNSTEYTDHFQLRRARRQETAAARSRLALPLLEDPPRPLTPPPAEVFIPAAPLGESPRHPDLTFKPATLRLPFMTFMILFCVFMIMILMLCAIYSLTHHGLTTFTGDIYGGLYFVFRFFPAMLGAIMILSIQAIMTEATRILPFTMMATTKPEQRTAGLFLGLFSRNFIIPRYDLFTSGYPFLGACYILFWVMIILELPLLSSLFSVINRDGDVRWATVQAIAWLLVVLHVFLLVAFSYLVLFFHRRVTGLVWDPRSIADITALLPRSNSLMNYTGTETSSTRLELRSLIGYQSDRLGYWRTDNENQGVFYGIGEVGIATHSAYAGQQVGTLPYAHQRPVGNYQNFLDHPLPKHSDRQFREKKVAALYNSAVRYQHLPWFLTDTFILLWPLIGFILLLALIIVSFLTSTNVRNGFDPRVKGTANNAGFSPAIFLYSFIPSLIGVIMFLLFQALDMAFRVLQPWKELAAAFGSPARRSLLLDYPSSYPVQCTIRALQLRHYRIAALSLFSTSFILIPILGGGIFFSLTALPSFTLLVFPNLPGFYILLVLLAIYLVGLFIPIPERDLMRLPHRVESLAEIISFLYNSPMLDDAAFRAPRNKADLVTRLTVGDPAIKFAFGWFNGRNGKETLGVDRIGRRDKSNILINSEVRVSRRERAASRAAGRGIERIRVVNGPGG